MAIVFDEQKKIFIIGTGNSTYAMNIEDNGVLRHNYWGGTVEQAEDFAISEMGLFVAGGGNDWATIWQEYQPYGGRLYNQETLKVTFADGVRDCWLIYVSHEINGNTLKITMKDKNYDLFVNLFYTIYDGLDIIDRHSEIINKTGNEITLETAMSATVYPTREDKYFLTHFDSGWAREYRRRRTEVSMAKITTCSRSGVSNSHNFPYFALDTGSTTEDNGVLYFGTLQWAGSWKMVCEKDAYDQVTLTGGINDFDFSYPLADGESFKTPVFTIGFTKSGFGAAKRMMHEYQRRHLLPARFVNKVTPVMYSAWDAFFFDVSEENMKELAAQVAPLGVELFCVDDGWFGDRDHDRAGLGDWYPSKKKFPNGLKPLIDYVNSLGMGFGIWVEPEMVNPDSDLYREHPDWVINFPGRERDLMRNQLILNLARDDVKQYILNFMDDLLKNHNIAYIKWDMNRFFAQPGWPEEELKKQKTIWVKYVENLYEIFDALTKNYPDVIFENCASGGTRADISLMRYCTLINRSDNQDPLDALYLHEGFLHFHPAKSAGGTGHIQLGPSGVNGRITSMEYKAHMGMLGSLSISVDIRKCTEEDIENIKKYVEQYKAVRETVQLGDFYLLNSVYDGSYASYEYVRKDRSEIVVFLFGKSQTFGYVPPRIRLKGLNPDDVYTIEGYKDMTGRGLMEIGLAEKAFGIRKPNGNKARLDGDYKSYVITLKRK